MRRQPSPLIDRDMIRASGARTLNDVFRLVPGFQTYAHSTEPARVSYHGLNDEDYSPRVQVLDRWSLDVFAVVRQWGELGHLAGGP